MMAQSIIKYKFTTTSTSVNQTLWLIKVLISRFEYEEREMH